MEISDIKEKLNIETVLKHYGLQANRNNMLKCPFHEEKEPKVKQKQETQLAIMFLVKTALCSHSTIKSKILVPTQKQIIQERMLFRRHLSTNFYRFFFIPFISVKIQQPGFQLLFGKFINRKAIRAGTQFYQ